MSEVYFNGRFLSQPVTGVQRYAIELLKSIDDILDSKDKVILLIPKNSVDIPLLKNIKIKKCGVLTGQLWEQLELPTYTVGKKLINLCNTSPIIKFKQVVTIHDAAVFATNQYRTTFRLWYKFLYKSNKFKKNKIVTVSNFSKTELIKYCGFSEDRITVIYEGGNHILNIEEDISVIQRNGLKNGKFALVVSSFSPNKNFNNVLKAMELIEDCDIDFVICGGANPKVFSGLTLTTNKRMKYLGYVSDSELKTLYSNAGCFIFTSFYEGFGLPPLEAITCGCPIVLSDRSSLPELFSGCAEFCDPNNIEDIAIKVKSALNNSKNQHVRAKNIDFSKKYNWRHTAEEFKEVFQR